MRPTELHLAQTEDSKLESSTRDQICTLVTVSGRAATRVDCRTDLAGFVVAPLSIFRRSSTLVPPNTDGRALLWECLFPDKPIPLPSEGVVDEFYGSLRRRIPEGVDEERLLDEVLREIKGK